MQKVRLFYQFVLEIQLVLNAVIRLAESILTHISGARSFLNILFVED